MKRNKKIWWWISYDKSTMTLYLGTRKHCMSLQCPFASWWKARKYFKRPKFKFYFGRTCKSNGYIETESFGKVEDWEPKGFWPAISTEWLKWNTFKWLPIYIYSSDICWKDKWNTPRYEYPGYFIIYFGRSYHKSWQIGFSVTAPEIFISNDCTHKDIDDHYWESLLWYNYYSKEYGMPDYKQRDIVKARDTYNKSIWSTEQLIPIKKQVEIVDTWDGDLFGKPYYVVKVKSRELKDLCECFPEFNTDKIVFRGYKNRSQICYFVSDYSRCKFGDDFLDLWITKDKCINDSPDILKECDNIEVSYTKNIQLGPTFKDEFLTKRAIKLIRNSRKS